MFKFYHLSTIYLFIYLFISSGKDQSKFKILKYQNIHNFNIFKVPNYINI